MQFYPSEPQQSFSLLHASQSSQVDETMSDMEYSSESHLAEQLFQDYDREFASAVMEADYNDASLAMYEEEVDDVGDDYCPDDMEITEAHSETSSVHEEYDYENDPLLHLIVGVQSYLSDMPTTALDRQESPLLDLQYKMYTYLKQRACDMGVDTSNLC